MTDIAVTTLASGVPVNGLTDPPEIRIRRLDTGALVTGPSAMTDAGGDGLYTFAFTPAAGLNYSFLIDADPTVTGQVDARFFDGAFNNATNDLWKDHGLDPTDDKIITEVTAGADYDEDMTGIHKDIIKAGATTTITRT